MTVRRMILGGILAGAFVLALLVPTLSGAGVSPATSSYGSPAVTHLAPVSIHFRPASGVQGGTVSVHAVVHNNGTAKYVATSCILWYRMGSSGGWTKAGSCLTASLFPHTFNAKTKSRFGTTQKVSSTFPTGTYEWKIQLVGKYNGLAADSHAGILKVTIT